jgi:dipeptidyl aminopeptidase/acylaminoacyl peptidase
MVTSASRSGIYQFQWSGDGRALLYLQDSDGDENFHLFGLDLASGRERDYTPIKGAKAQNLLICPDHPQEILVGVNLRDPRLFDMYRVNLSSGALKLDTENPGDVRWWLPDSKLEIRAAVAIDPATADQDLRVRDGRNQPWRVLIHWPFGESGVLEGYGSQLAITFSPDGRSLYVQSALHADTTQLLKIDLAAGNQRYITSHPKADIWNVMDITLYDFAEALFHPESGEPQAVAFEYLKPEWKVLDSALKADFDFLQQDRSAVLASIQRDHEDRRWLVGYIYDTRLPRYFLYERQARQLEPLFAEAPELGRFRFAPMEPVTFKARDGVTITGYLTLPQGVKAKNLPMVLLVHGGPWSRDSWGFDPESQFLANRGYAVFKVNFRGSTGFGKKFLNAGIGQLGVGAMQHDLSDAVAWAVKKGIADPKRTAIYGTSYGGYAALAGLAFTPGLYACGVDVCGPSNWATFFQSIPDFWKPIKTRWLRRVGVKENDAEANRRISPAFHGDAIRAPLLIGHGVNDPRVTISASEQIVKTMRAKGLPVTFVVYPDEGHGIGRTENLLDFYGRLEEFLAKHLGGRCEPWLKIAGASVELH